MLNNPRSTERDNQNSLRKFPFSDAASCSNGACVIPPGAIVDAQIYVPGREPGRVWLSSVGRDGKLRFSDAVGEFAETCAAATPETAVPVTFTGDGGPCPGGVVVFGNETDVSTLRSYGGMSFTAEQAELAPAAVAWPGMPGVLGFRLDDGHVVYGAVKMRGENGCVVATYVDANGTSRLRISAIGRTVESEVATGFVTRVSATSDNRHFVLSAPGVSGKVIAIQATGSEMTQDDGLVADMNDICDKVRKAVGTKPSERAAADGTSCICPTDATLYTITLKNAAGTVIGDPIRVVRGGSLGKLDSAYIPSVPGKIFIGYFDSAEDSGGRRYYRANGEGVGRFTAEGNVTLYERFIEPDSSNVDVTFAGYGTLHLTAPSDATYANPIRISGNDSPVPTVSSVPASAVTAGGADAIADMILNPSVPSGEVRIGLAGMGKVATS